MSSDSHGLWYTKHMMSLGVPMNPHTFILATFVKSMKEGRFEAIYNTTHTVTQIFYM